MQYARLFLEAVAKDAASFCHTTIILIPITIQTCELPHVYPSGKHAVFQKIDAQL
jgi:hypothetical protein